eukprot:TRINITY_DN46027_c0_g1_i1.p1 TRINITY_DN46027_c0_g1~~TRINITY_DN46027_c0_g1_i1.p1  ORF type:complete len:284 (+),score=59.97 TRINITY_DN46027_c0_g1_i1:82-852(+)
MENVDGDGQRCGSYRERIAMLSDRLCVVHEGVDLDRCHRFDHLQGKLKCLDEQLANCQDQSLQKVTVLKDQLRNFQEALAEERLRREKLTETKENEIARLDAMLQAALEAEQSARRETESRILHVFEQKTNALKEEISESGQVRVESAKKLQQYLEVDIPKLYESLSDEVRNRELMEQRLLNRAMEEVTELQAAILGEKKAREDTEEAMLRMMEDIVAKMHGEIASEKRERELTEEKLLQLLRDTCGKMQMASRTL